MWRARWVAAAGAFVVSLDSLLNIAFPAITAHFATTPESMRWIISAYVLTYALTSFAGGALGDTVGHGRVFQAGAVVGLASYVVCGLAPSFALLVAGRILQGVGAGLVYGTAPGIVTLASSPAARGRAVGFFNAAVGLASTLGPLVAGALVDAFGWRSVFLVRVPLGLVLVASAVAALPSRPVVPTARLIREGEKVGTRVIVACLLAFVANAGIFAIWLLAPFYLVGVRGLTTPVAGAVFMLTPLAMTAAAPLAGRLADQLGTRGLVVAGLVLEAAGLWAIGTAGAQTPIPALAFAFAATGFGLGLFQVPNMTLVMTSFGARRQGTAGGLIFFARTLGIVAGVLALAQVFATRRLTVGEEPAFADAFFVAASAVAAAGLLGLAAARQGTRAGHSAP
jgi:MFS family permease